MNAKRDRLIKDAIRQFKFSSIVIEKEVADWESDPSKRDLLIFFITRLAAYKSNLLSLEEAIGELFSVDLSKITDGLSKQKEVMK
ncbi:hypothetical protein F4X33_08730 [Candidatus Poribacteria bacterium]|nr:hypothetical protein [Candidatus Poribacteria bacterium]